ncbi:uncharacterized protein I206_102421 [Kwoniella pini CBS 10737]|uniref:Uncharacterized protein n=1 Tax=Kwoniella pini CBS 10737 TaxID=1296096 RepID=A0A1B9I5B4_9TREE|nr:uncharacterized protein I206_02768 [Kwoniella pini CBS 10737]OCF50712.1 hypothetical protein I206_02768 [Kwoniella pini CBS 10737]
MPSKQHNNSLDVAEAFNLKKRKAQDDQCEAPFRRCSSRSISSQTTTDSDSHQQSEYDKTAHTEKSGILAMSDTDEAGENVKKLRKERDHARKERDDARTGQSEAERCAKKERIERRRLQVELERMRKIVTTALHG